MNDLLLQILTEIIQLVGITVSVLVMRYLLALSTPEQDRRWLERQWWYREMQRLKFYRGMDFLYQVKARRLLEGWDDAD